MGNFSASFLKTGHRGGNQGHSLLNRKRVGVSGGERERERGGAFARDRRGRCAASVPTLITS